MQIFLDAVNYYYVCSYTGLIIYIRIESEAAEALCTEMRMDELHEQPTIETKSETPPPQITWLTNKQLQIILWDSGSISIVRKRKKKEGVSRKTALLS